MATIPQPTKQLEYKKEWMDAIHSIYKRGYVHQDHFEELIAVKSEEWKEQDFVFAPGWSLRTLSVFAYLKHLPKKPHRLVAPPGLNWPGDLDGDLTARLEQVARKWRLIEPDGVLWEYFESLKLEFAGRMLRIWPDSFLTDDLPHFCDIFAQMIKTTYLYESFAKKFTKKDCPPIMDSLAKWVQEQIRDHKRMMTNQTPVDVVRLYMSTIIRPGEEDQHARTEGGVFAAGARDVLESQRTNIPAEALWEACGNFDTEGSGGILIFHLLERISKQYCFFFWISNNLFLDTDISTEQMIFLRYREYPYVLYLFGTYFVVNPKRYTYYETKSPVLVLQLWFKEFWKMGTNKFFDGDKRYDLRNLPSSFPLKKEIFVNDDPYC
jgi:hypothetical protein